MTKNHHEKHKVSRLKRYSDIVSVLIKFGFEDIIYSNRKLIRGIRRAFGQKRDNPIIHGRWARVREMLEELGPTFVKFGQVLSNRPDVLPGGFIKELKKLQESVPPFDGQIAKQIIENELGQPIGELFSEFEIKPKASASIAQVHYGVLKTGQEVAIKVMRPGIKSIIRTDISIMYTIARLVEQQFYKIRLLTPSQIVEEFEKAITKETNFQIEFAHLERFRKNFKGDKRIKIPNTYPQLCTENVLTMEYIHGTSPDNLEKLKEKGIDTKKLAADVSSLVLKQIFYHSFFHADPHPGNIKIMDDGTICFLDYGMMGSLITEWKKQLTNLLIGVARRDASKVAETIIVLSKTTELHIKSDLEHDINELLDRFSYVQIKYLKLGDLLHEVLDIIFEYQLSFPASFYLLSKSIGTIESIARDLDPEFNVIETIEPFAKGMVKDRFSPKALTKSMAFTAAEFSLLVKELPGETRDILQQLRNGNTRIQFYHRGLDSFSRKVERSGNRLSFAIVLASLVIGSSLITVSHVPPLWKDIPLIGLTGFVASGFMGFVLLLSTWRRTK